MHQKQMNMVDEHCFICNESETGDVSLATAGGNKSDEAEYAEEKEMLQEKQRWMLFLQDPTKANVLSTEVLRLANRLVKANIVFAPSNQLGYQVGVTICTAH